MAAKRSVRIGLARNLIFFSLLYAIQAFGNPSYCLQTKIIQATRESGKPCQSGACPLHKKKNPPTIDYYIPKVTETLPTRKKNVGRNEKVKGNS